MANSNKDIERYLKKVDYVEQQSLITVGLLLLSIRNDWSSEKSVRTRKNACLDLINLIRKDCLCGRKDKYIDILETTVKNYHPDMDGRYFRENFPNGYIGICPDDFGKLEED